MVEPPSGSATGAPRRAPWDLIVRARLEVAHLTQTHDVLRELERRASAVDRLDRARHQLSPLRVLTARGYRRLATCKPLPPDLERSLLQVAFGQREPRLSLQRDRRVLEDLGERCLRRRMRVSSAMHQLWLQKVDARAPREARAHVPAHRGGRVLGRGRTWRWRASHPWSGARRAKGSGAAAVGSSQDSAGTPTGECTRAAAAGAPCGAACPDKNRRARA